MAKKSISFSFLNLSVTIDGIQAVGFWDGDDAVEVRMRNDIASLMVGVDGHGVNSLNADKSVEIVIRLMQASKTNQQLYRILNRQQNAFRTVLFPVNILDTDAKEGGNTAEASIMGPPALTFGRNATVREWTLQAVDWDWNIPDASLLPVG